MKKKLYVMAVVAGLAIVGSGSAMAVTINYSSSFESGLGSAINFNGTGGFYFSVDGAGNDFQITGPIGNSANGDYGTMGTQVFTIGTISGNSASVSGSTTLTIVGGGGTLTGTLTWLNIQQQGTGGNLNLIGNVNLTGVTYTGTDATLKALATNSGGNDLDTLSFQFGSDMTLAQLVGPPAQNSSYSGSISNSPDGGATVMLLGAALSAMGLLRRKLIA